MSTKVFLISGLINFNGKQLKEVNVENHKTNEKNCLLFDSTECEFYEVMKQTNPYRSWICDNTIHEDGNTYVVTPYDMIFIVLPIFMKKRTQFRSIFDILTDGFDKEISREMIKKIESKLDFDAINLITDVKFINEEMFVKLNMEKVMNCLQCKVDNIVEALKQNNISVMTDGCKASIYNTIKEDDHQNKAQFLKTAFELISRYLTEEICTDLKKHLGLPEDNNEAKISMNSSSQIKRKIDQKESSAPLEDYSSYSTGKGNSADNKRSKMSRTQKQLLKVDKTGMKTISSFFKPKTK